MNRHIEIVNSQMNPEKKTRTWLPLWVSLGIALGIFIGSMFAKFGVTGKMGGTGKMDAVFNYVRDSYVDTVDMYELVEESLPHVLQQLDPHSEYISAAAMKRVSEQLEGHFSGIGVSFYVLKDTIVVTGIIDGGPSQAAGIRQWDRIVTVNDSLMAGQKITNEDVMNALRGERGSEVKLGIKRAGNSQMETIVITRADIPTKSVTASYMLTETVGFIKIANFGFNTFNEFISAISKLKRLGARAFVIDLRGNLGGSLDAVVAMVNEFLNRGDLIVYTEGRNFPRTDNPANGSGTCKTDDVVVLIDEMSASASEIFAGAIQDHDRGLVLGRRSFGKGLVQSERKFPDGSAVRLTIARYYTASGRSIQRKYEKGKYDEYEMEAINRYMQGDYVNEDSTSNLTPFKTLGGRMVYGGDGIMPDVFLPRDTAGYNPYFNSMANRGLIEEYAVTYADANRDVLAEFSSPQDMHRYLLRQPLILNLVSFADNKGIRRRPYYIQEATSLMETHLAAYIVRSFFEEEGFWSVFLRNDNVVKRATELIEAGKASPEAVVNQKYV